MVEPADHQPLQGHASREGHHEGQWDREDDRQRVIGHKKLHDIACIGAHHDKLSMRHVDDPHHPEGDGKPDRRKKIDRGQRQGVKPQVKRLVHGQPRLDVIQRGLRGLRDGQRRANENLVEAEASDSGGDVGLCDQRRGVAIIGQHLIGCEARVIGNQRSDLHARDHAPRDVGNKRVADRICADGCGRKLFRDQQGVSLVYGEVCSDLQNARVVRRSFCDSTFDRHQRVQSGAQVNAQIA